MKKVVFLGVFLCLNISSASAVCGSPQPRLVCAEYFKEPVVVIARMTRARYVEKDDAMDYHLYSMQTEKVVRGQINPNFRIYEENSSGRASFAWIAGESYLLFLSYVKRDGSWELDGCGNSAPLKKSGPALRQIEKIQAAGNGAGGEITGVVWPDTGITIVAQRTGGEFQTRSNKSNEFKIHVPVGDYSVRAVQGRARFVADDFSYERPAHLRVENGGCVQVALRRSVSGESRQPSERLPGR
jgi:hypothetical protein